MRQTCAACVFISLPTCERSKCCCNISGLTWSENVCKAFKDDPPMPILAKLAEDADILRNEVDPNTP
ncbi:hypothetical protein GFL39_23835 [Rhizobium leguminosarum bv. viciae]|nr:hypothetical protein [Rhizobium leguminosarum bv. viciae]NKL86762.1 hypothetical protein [Rhizobium leguminosarum bv. viciae]NKL93035.1 hypothetical protein [Rhizobium leguminosarum bv. viciae]NKM90724.1 hypothetical protein [Rhizobium leguminosarum bv. viciae]